MDSFVFYTHYAEKMKKLPPEQAANLLYGICEYVENGTEPELNDMAADMCFSFIRTQLDKDISKHEETCRKRSEAGRKGAAATNSKRRQRTANSGSNSAFSKSNEPDGAETKKAEAGRLNPEKKPRKKVNEPLKLDYGEFVRMTEGEHEKLMSEYGPELTDRMVEVLDKYKRSNGKTYKNDYQAILNWVADRVKEEFERKGEESNVGK